MNRDIEKCFYEIYVNKENCSVDYSKFTYIHTFYSKEDAVIFLLNLLTIKDIKDFNWKCDDNKVILIDNENNVAKAYIEIGYESIYDNLVNKDLTAVYGCIIKMLNKQIGENL